MPGNLINITVMNQSTVLTDGAILASIPDFQVQISRDFAPAWGVDAALNFLSSSEIADHPEKLADVANHYWLVILDTSDVACFTGDTKVSLMNGTEVTFKDLVEKYSDKQFYVYSYDIENQEIVPGLAHSPRLAKQNSKLVEVELDNGEKIKCTPDHLFLMRDGTYKEAQDLKENDSLMPLYRSFTVKDPHKRVRVGYELCHAGSCSEEQFTHYLSGKLSNTGSCSVCGSILPDYAHQIRHHRDFNKLNNSPENIQWLTSLEHAELHQRLSRNLAMYAKTEKHKKRASETLKKWWLYSRDIMLEGCRKGGASVDGTKNLMEWNKSEEGKKLSLEMVDKFLIPYARSKENREKMRLLGPERLTAYNVSDKGRLKSRETALKKHREGILNPKEFVTQLHKEGKLPGFNNHDRWHVKREIKKEDCIDCNLDTLFENCVPEAMKELQFNHKVVSVKFLNHVEDVYDITVEKYHNFALTSGVFVHNSALGYHDLNPAGYPISKVFAKSDLDYGTSWTNTVSHELLEMLADPNINKTAQVQDPGTGRDVFYAIEVCDAPEADRYGYLINNTLVSDFVFPSWFQPFGRAPFDHCNHITAPFQLMPGGYIGKYDSAQGGWTQVTAESVTSAKVILHQGLSIDSFKRSYGSIPKVGSRRERRSRPHYQWIHSQIKSGS
jgi:hypothetical protein